MQYFYDHLRLLWIFWVSQLWSLRSQRCCRALRHVSVRPELPKRKHRIPSSRSARAGPDPDTKAALTIRRAGKLYRARYICYLIILIFWHLLHHGKSDIKVLMKNGLNKIASRMRASPWCINSTQLSWHSAKSGHHSTPGLKIRNSIDDSMY